MAQDIYALRKANPWADRMGLNDGELIDYVAKVKGISPDELGARLGITEKPAGNSVVEVGKGALRGLAFGVPTMINKAAAYFSPTGSDAERYFNDNVDSMEQLQRPFRPDMAGRGGAAQAFIAGAESLAPSLIGAGVTAVNPVAGAAVIGGLYGGSTANDSYGKVLRDTGDVVRARRAGALSGGQDAALEFASDLVGAKLLTGAGRGFNTLRRDGVSAAVNAATNPGWVRPFVKTAGQNVLVETGTEGLQNYNQTAIENYYGAEHEDPWNSAVEGAKVGGAMSLLMAPLGIGGHRAAGIRRGIARDLLRADPTETQLADVQQAALRVRDDVGHSTGRPAADSWYNDFMAQQFAARNDAAAQAYPQAEFPLSPAQQADYVQPDMFGGREVVAPATEAFEDYTGPMAQHDPRQASLFGYNGAPTPLATLTEDRTVPYTSPVTPEGVFSAVDQSTGLRARDSAKAFEQPSGTYASDPFNGGQERELTTGELSRFQAGDHQSVLDAWREESGVAAPVQPVEVAPKNQLAQRFEASLKQAVADGRVPYEHPIVKDWAASKKTVSEAKSFEMALDDVLNPPIPADAAPQVAAVPPKLAPVQQRVYDHIKQAVVGNDASSIVDGAGVIQYQKIGTALGMKRGSVKVAVDGVMRQIAKQQGKTVDEVKAALAQRSAAVRTTELADEEALGLSPAHQATRLDEENLFGDNQSMSEVESVGGSQSNLATKSSPETEAYLEANKHVPTAVHDVTARDTELTYKRHEEAKANRAAFIQEALGHPEAQNAALDWDDACSVGAPKFAELTDADKAGWVMEYVELAEAGEAWKQIEQAQLTFEQDLRGYERGGENTSVQAIPDRWAASTTVTRSSTRGDGLQSGAGAETSGTSASAQKTAGEVDAPVLLPTRREGDSGDGQRNSRAGASVPDGDNPEATRIAAQHSGVSRLRDSNAGAHAGGARDAGSLQRNATVGRSSAPRNESQLGNSSEPTDGKLGQSSDPGHTRVVAAVPVRGTDTGSAAGNRTQGVSERNPIEQRATNLREVTGEKQSARLDKLVERYKSGEISLDRLTDELQQLEEQAFPPERGGKGIQYSENNDYSEEEKDFFKSMGIEVKDDGTNSRAKKDSADTRNTGRPDADPVAGRAAASGVSGERVRARLLRGSTRPLSAGDFHSEALGRSSGNPNATLGVWFTDSQSNASRYGEVNTHQITLDNAAAFTTSDAPSFASQQEAATWAADLKAQGFDGAVFDYSDVGGPKEYVVFSPDSVEGLVQDGQSAEELRATLKGSFLSPQKFDSTVGTVGSIDELPSPAKKDASEANGRVQAFVDARGKVWMIAGNIEKGRELGVFLHEVGVHLGMEGLIGKAAFNGLTAQIDAWAKQSRGQEAQIAKLAIKSAAQSSSENQQAEKLAYFVEHAVTAGINPTATQELSSPIGKWFRTLVAALKNALSKIGLRRFDTLTAQDIVDLAYGAANLQLGSIKPTGSVQFSEAPSQAYARKVATQLAGRTGAMVSDDVTHTITKLARNFMSLADVVEAAKRKLPSASKWYEAVQNSMAERNRLAQDAEKIAEQAARLSSTQLDATNAFISRATVEQKWGYDPGFARKVSVDPEMARAFAALGKDAQAVVRGVFQHGEDMVTKKQEILNTLGIDQMFETSGKLEGPYAPLKRFGNYVAVLKSKELLDAERNDDAKREDMLKSDGKHYVVSFFDTMGQARQFAEAHAGKFALADAFEKSQLVAQRGAMPEQTLRKIMAALKVTDGVPAQARQAVEQMLQDMYFQTLDEHNARTSGLRRKNREGYDEDMLRSFLSHARAEANFLSNMKFGGKINDAFYAMQREAKDSSGKRVGQDEFNILAEHYAKNLENKDTPIQDRIMALTSAWQLATSPAYHITNSLQGLMVTVPRLAADFGNYGRAWHHMMEGYRTLAQVGLTGALNLNKVRSAGLREALQRAEDMGVLDVGMDSDLTQFEATRTGVGAVDKTTAVARRAMFLLRKVSRQVEVWNRVSSATAAYNIALENGKSAQEAQDYAVRVLQTTQGDFSRTNAPLILKKLPKVMTQYKKYQFMMGALYVKAAHDAFAGQSPEIRAIGRRMLAYKMFHASVGAGVLGLPLMNAVGMLFSAAFGDDDEPADLERTLRDAIGDDDVANLLLHGPLTMMGLDMSAKLGEDKIFSVAPYSDFKLDSSKGVAKTVFDIMAGPSGSQLGRMGNGVGFFERGEYYRGLENFMPKGFADAMKAFRVANEGYALNNGDVMFSPDEISGFSTAMSFLGMPSTDLKRMDWLRGQQYELTQFYSDRTKEIQRQYKQAFVDGDTDAMEELRAAWIDLQDGKDRVRGQFNGSHEALRKQPLSALLRYPQTSAARERKLQKAAPDL